MTPQFAAQLLSHDLDYFCFAAERIETDFGSMLYSPDFSDDSNYNRAALLRSDLMHRTRVADEVISFFEERKIIVAADLDPTAERYGIGAEFRARQFTPAESDWTAMLHTPGKEPWSRSKEIAVASVENSRAEEWVQIIAAEEGQIEIVRLEANCERNRLLLARINGKPVAACDLFSKDGWGRIDSVFTLPEFRNRGAASALVLSALKFSQLIGNEITYLMTEGKSPAERLYRKLGFESLGKLPWQRHYGS